MPVGRQWDNIKMHFVAEEDQEREIKYKQRRNSSVLPHYFLLHYVSRSYKSKTMSYDDDSAKALKTHHLIHFFQS